MHIRSRAQNRTGSELCLIEDEELGMKTDNPMQTKSYAFPLWIVGPYQYLCDEKKEYVLLPGTFWNELPQEILHRFAKFDSTTEHHGSLNCRNEPYPTNQSHPLTTLFDWAR